MELIAMLRKRDSHLGRGTTIDVRIPLEGRKARRRRGAPPR
jgi:hypothetical protein